MQDGASMHKAGSSMKFLQGKRIRLFNRGIWPPKLPDMNPIEHIWPMVGKILSGWVFNNREDHWEGLADAFAQITPAQIIRQIDSMPRRLAALRAVKGGHTRY